MVTRSGKIRVVNVCSPIAIISKDFATESETTTSKDIAYLNFLHRASNVILIIQHILHGNFADFDIIRKQQLVNSLCGMGHKHPALERSLWK